MKKPTTIAHRLAAIALSLTLAIPSPVRADDYRLPEIGAPADNLLTPLQEKRLGQAFMRYVRTSNQVIEDPLLADYIQKLGHTLVQKGVDSGGDFHFFLVDDDQVNAFAGPGGHIGVYTGLVLTTQSESELAAVLAHEIAHVTQHHLKRAWQDSGSLGLVQGAALLAAIVLGATLGGDAGIAAAMGVQAALAQHQINFTRSNEQEADRVGIQILDRAGFDPRAMPTFFGRMGRVNDDSGTQVPEFLRTHPVTNARIADSLARAEQLPYRQHADSLDYLLTRARLRERSFHDPAAAVRHFRAVLDQHRYRSRAAARYGLTLALLRAGRLDEAAREADELLRDHPKILQFIVAAARIDMERGRGQAAIGRLRRAAARFPFSRPLQTILAEMELRAGRPQDALDRLQALVETAPGEPRLHRLLAQALAATGHSAESHHQLALAHYLRGDLESARLQLRIALRQARSDRFERARAEAELARVEAELEALKKEKRR